MDKLMKTCRKILEDRISFEEKYIKEFESGESAGSEECYLISKEMLPKYQKLLSEMDEEFPELKEENDVETYK